MADLKVLAEELVNLTVKEVNELANILKEEYGIEPAAAAVAVAGPAAAGAAAAAEEKTNFDVVLTDAGAATLVLPFESTIPTGASCYTLTHTDGSAVVTATPIATTLPANTPVLVNASEGSYKFVSTATSGAPATGSDPVTNGALTGVFSQQTFGTEITSYDNLYILNKINENVGFYKAANGLKVGANRCYLTAANVPSATAARGLEIVFDDEEVTSISEELRVKGEESAPTAEFFDLQGRKVAQPTKGLYIVNGKKVVIK